MINEDEVNAAFMVVLSSIRAVARNSPEFRDKHDYNALVQSLLDVEHDVCEYLKEYERRVHKKSK